MLPLKESQQIVSLQYQQSELLPEIPVLKDSIVDVCCTDSIGRKFIVEMQMYWTNSFKNRVIFNTSKAYVRQLDSGKNYRLLQPVYALNFVNDTFDPDESVYYHDYKIVNVDNAEKQIEGLEFVFIELPKFCPANRTDKKLYDLWLTFLTQIQNASAQVPSALLEEEVTRDAVRYLERNSYTSAQLEAYDKYWDVVRTERTFYDDALEKGLTEGMAKGKAEGITEGIAKGKAEGIAEGITEGIAKGKADGKAEVVIAGKAGGLSLEQIQAVTGFSKEKIEEILRLNSASV
jgi:predicted transposase/invertase (TIGR01784 family)